MRLLQLFTILTVCVLSALSPSAQAKPASKNVSRSHGEILFLCSQPQQKPDIYAIGGDGNGLRKISRQPLICIGVSWSYDKRNVVTTLATRIGSGKAVRWRYSLAILNVKTQNVRNIIIAGHPEFKTFNPAFSPSGKQIIFTGGTRPLPFLYMVNLDGSHLRQLTHTGGENGGRFSPDGKKIVFSRFQKQQEDIFIANADGSHERQLTRNSDKNQTPALSPDAKKIAFVSRRSGTYQIYIMNADGTHQLLLSKTRENSFSSSLSPNGKQIAFSRRVGQFDQIFVVNADGTKPRRITQLQKNCYYPDWR